MDELTHPTPVWETVSHLFGHYSGSASELFVVGLPESHLDHVIGVMTHLPDLEINVHPQVALDDGHVRVDAAWTARLRAPQQPKGSYAFRAANGGSEHLQIYVWPLDNEAFIEVEFVFWNDRTFPKHLSRAERSKRLHRLVGLAEVCRFGAPDSRCLFTDEHSVADARALIGQDRVVVW